MRNFLYTSIAILLAVAFCGLSVSVFNDRSLFTSPPEARAEGFVRTLVSERFELTNDYLIEDSPLEPVRIAARMRPSSAVMNVAAATIRQSDTLASVAATVHYASRDSTLHVVGLQFENGIWRVSSFEDSLAPTESH